MEETTKFNFQVPNPELPQGCPVSMLQVRGRDHSQLASMRIGRRGELQNSQTAAGTKGPREIEDDPQHGGVDYTAERSSLQPESRVLHS